MYERKVSVPTHSVESMSVAAVPEPVADLVNNPLTGWLGDVLAGLADGVAESRVPGIWVGARRCPD